MYEIHTLPAAMSTADATSAVHYATDARCCIGTHCARSIVHGACINAPAVEFDRFTAELSPSKLQVLRNVSIAAGITTMWALCVSDVRMRCSMCAQTHVAEVLTILADQMM